MDQTTLDQERLDEAVREVRAIREAQAEMDAKLAALLAEWRKVADTALPLIERMMNSPVAGWLGLKR